VTIGREFFDPRAVAIIGASSDRDKLGGRLLEILRQHGFGGSVYLVNPNHPEIAGLRTYPTVDALPEGIDLALILLPAAQVLPVVQRCAAKGVRNAMILSSGFAEESGSGGEIEARLRDIALHTGMRIAGPNCEGFLNVVGSVAAGFSPAIDYERGLREAPKKGPVAVISQSGGLGFSIFQAGLARGLGFSYVMSTGNEADLDVLDYLEFFVRDPETKIVAMFVEGFSRAGRFAEIARLARESGTSIVVAKVGRSEAGRRAVQSHTAHMAGRDVAYDAAFRRAGVLRVHDPLELVDVLVALDRFPAMAGNRIGILTLSGGAGAWAADALEAADLVVPELDAATQDTLRPLVPSYGSVRNPVDATAQIVQTGGLADALALIAGAPGIDGVVAALSLAAPAILEREEQRLRTTVEAVRKPIVAYSYTPAHPDAARVLERIGIPWYESPARAAHALRALHAVRRSGVEEQVGGQLCVAPVTGPVGGATVLCEYEVLSFLGQAGVRVPRGIMSRSAEDAVVAAGEIGAAVALKVQSPAVPHKREVGGVALGVAGEHDVRTGYGSVLAAVRDRVPGADVHGVLVQEMLRPGVEMMVGRLEDEEFGPLVVVGLGGSNVELHRDVFYELAPVDEGQALRMIRSLRCWPALSRGQGAADVAALARLVAAVSRDIIPVDGVLSELDLNPVLVYPAGEGVAVVDAQAVVNRQAVGTRAEAQPRPTGPESADLIAPSPVGGRRESSW
jgi:acyl-CoA synthetase (NDP forming)